MTHSCLLDNTQAVKCSGNDGYGQQGDGPSYSPSSSFTTVPGLNGVSSIAAGYRHTCVMLLDGSVLCWGDGGSGRLGNGVANAEAHAPEDATALNAAGSANIVIVAFFKNTYVYK
jgi:alpha-tubulin suppressor-like RCC1 family protein